MTHNNQPITLLGGISPAHFLSEYWQKKPLLIRKAIPNFEGLVDPNTLAGLACDADVQSRIVTFQNNQWGLQNGPFDEAIFANLPEKNWTLLVQNLNHFLPKASELLQQFNFIPQARLDDLMVSYAPEDGSVGPHFDSYDVFLLQGQGKRLWQVSAQTDLTLVEGAPLCILKDFTAEQSWTLETGDMLYLPPKLAHWGVAQASNDDGCMTYSIGFRAPKQQELKVEFLSFLQEYLSESPSNNDPIYTDPDLKLQENSAEISKDMVNKVSNHLRSITWKTEDVSHFIGKYTTEPKPDVFFDQNPEMAIEYFNTTCLQHGITLDLKSKLLFHDATFFINGETIDINNKSIALMECLAHHRCLRPAFIKNAETAFLDLSPLLYSWYVAGYCHLNDA